MGIFTRNQDNTSGGTNTKVQFTATGNSVEKRTPAPAPATNQSTMVSQAVPSIPQQPRPEVAPAQHRENQTNRSYGIDDAVELMRQMPDGNLEIIITVVKKTLESTNIRITDIIADAQSKENDIRVRTKKLEVEIRDLEEKIMHRNNEINNLLNALDETVQVREQLQLSEAKDEANASRFTTQSVDMRSIKLKSQSRIQEQSLVQEQVAREVKALALELDNDSEQR